MPWVALGCPGLPWVALGCPGLPHLVSPVNLTVYPFGVAHRPAKSYEKDDLVIQKKWKGPQEEDVGSLVT